jgi:hypothetical protein
MDASASDALENDNAELVAKHSEIWALMGLSSRAMEELDRIVIDLSNRLDRARRECAEASAPEAKRVDHQLTRGEYLERHGKRFDALGISPSTQAELLDAAGFTWSAMHDASVPQEQREAAETIRTMMLAMGGPPPCCDDLVLQMAGREASCS